MDATRGALCASVKRVARLSKFKSFITKKRNGRKRSSALIFIFAKHTLINGEGKFLKNRLIQFRYECDYNGMLTLMQDES